MAFFRLQVNRLLPTVFGMILLFTSLNAGNQELDTVTIEELVDSYVEALKAGDSIKIVSMWTDEARNRSGFFSLSMWKGEECHLSRASKYWDSVICDYEIIEYSLDETIKSALVRWIRCDNGNDRPDNDSLTIRFYFEQKGNRWFLQHPIYALSGDWHTFETENICFHYPPQLDIEKYMNELLSMEVQVAELQQLFDVPTVGKIDYYKTLSPDDCGRLMYNEPAFAYCKRSNPEKEQWFDYIASTSFCNPHEYVHGVTALAGIPDINVFFLEGIAVALGGTTWLTNTYSFVEAKNMIGTHVYIPIVQLMERGMFLEHSDVSYHEAGSFVKFLIDAYGFDNYIEFCRSYREGSNLDDHLNAHFKGDLKELEKQWHSYLQRIDLPDVDWKMPSTITRAFYRNDPTEDDTGDGDYRYPLDSQFQKGVFDLTRFSVSTDGKMVYFCVELNDLSPTAIDQSTGERYCTGVFIAIKKGGFLPPSYRAKRFGGVAFPDEDGYDIVVGAGFGVYAANNVRKNEFRTGEIRDSITSLEGDSIFFSIPVSFIGFPNEDWEYFVGVGLQTDYGAGITYGQPLDIEESASAFRCGGGIGGSREPRFMDILLPINIDQSALLAAYQTTQRSSAVVPMITLREVKGATGIR